MASISNPTTSSNLSTLTTGTSGSNLSTLVANSLNISTAGSILNAASTEGKILAKTAGGIHYDWVTAPSSGTTINFDNTIVQTGGTYGVASNISTVVSVISSTATTGYLLAKTGPSAYGWQAPPVSGLLPITINLYYINTTGSETDYTDGTPGTVCIDGVLTTASNTLPSGWAIVYGTAGTKADTWTQIGLSNATYSAGKMSPILTSVSFALSKTGNVGNKWVTYNLDSFGMNGVTEVAPVNGPGTTGLYTAAPQPSLDIQIPYQALLKVISKPTPAVLTAQGYGNNDITLPAYAATGASGMYVKLHFVFDLNQL